MIKLYSVLKALSLLEVYQLNAALTCLSAKHILALFLQMQINLISALYVLTYTLCKHFLANFPICVNFTAVYY